MSTLNLAEVMANLVEQQQVLFNQQIQILEDLGIKEQVRTAWEQQVGFQAEELEESQAAATQVSALGLEMSRMIANLYPDKHMGEKELGVLENLIGDMEKVFDTVQCPPNYWVSAAVYYLRGQATLLVEDSPTSTIDAEGLWLDPVRGSHNDKVSVTPPIYSVAVEDFMHN